MKPLVSVVIPLYNKESTVANAIDSVLAQTVADFELIVIDGHSTDNSAAIVSSYIDERIRLFSQMGMGVSSARNQGITLSRANFIAFLDADDAWMPDYLETVLRLRAKFPDAGMYGTAYSVFQKGKFVHDVVLNTASGERVLTSYFGDFVELGCPLIITSSFAAPKNVLEGVSGYPEYLRVGEDHELFGKIALRYPVAYSPKVCSRYNLDSENCTDVVDFILETPLESYLRSQQLETFLKDDSSFAEYMDYWCIRTGGRNIYSGFREEGRAQLFSVASKRYRVLKRGFLLLSYLPISFGRLPSGFVRGILRIANLSI